MLDKNLTKNIEKKLLQEKQRLEKELKEFTKKNIHNINDYDAHFPSFGDKDDENAAEVATYSDNLTLERTLESALRDVNDALKRMKNGKYGLCRYCGKPIDPQRLIARPTSSACVLCKEKLSKK
jgi:RNA polymerase-binding protein DksA